MFESCKLLTSQKCRALEYSHWNSSDLWKQIVVFGHQGTVQMFGTLPTLSQFMANYYNIMFIPKPNVSCPFLHL